MDKKYKHNYLAFLTDENVTDSFYYDKGVEKRYKIKLYENHRKKFFCSCGNTFELNKRITEQQDHIFCSNCNTQKKFEEIILMSSRLRDNIINIRYSTFVDGDLVKFVKFTDYVGLNLKSKNLFFTNSRYQIIFNKKTKRFFLYNSKVKGKKIKSIGLKGIEEVVSSFFQGSSPYSRVCDNSSVCKNVPYKIRDVKKSMLNPTNEFIDELKKHIDKKDIERINSNLYDLTLLDLIEDKNSYNKNFLQKLSDNLNILIPVLQYNYFSTLLFDKGYLFFGKSLRTTPPVSYIKRLKPTSPKNILKAMAIQKIEYSKKIDREYLNDLKSRKKNTEDIVERSNLTLQIQTIESQLSEKSSAKRRVNKFNIPNILYKELKYDNVELVDDFYLLLQDFDYNFLLSLLQKNRIDNTIFVLKNLLITIRHRDINIERDSYEKILSHAIKISNKEIEFNLQIYVDTIGFVIQRNYGIDNFLKIKSWNKIDELHDSLSQIIQLEKLEKFNEGIKNFAKKYTKIKESTINGINFTLIDNVFVLEKESKIMSHCVKTYAERLSRGRHLIFSVIDTQTKDRATLEFYNKTFENEIGHEDFWVFNQLKSKFNQKATENIIDATIEFCDKILKKEKIKFEINEKSFDLKGSSKATRMPMRQVEQLENRQAQNLNEYWDLDLPF